MVIMGAIPHTEMTEASINSCFRLISSPAYQSNSMLELFIKTYFYNSYPKGHVFESHLRYQKKLIKSFLFLII